MRENIGLYRGKRKDNGEWIEGSLLKVTISGETYYFIFCDDFALDGFDVKALSRAIVDPETIGEYTGLPDKNGKKIFEGDIVRLLKMLFVVECHGAEYVFGRIPGQPYCYPYFVSHADSCEVIGNIHDNPELLEVSK